MTIIHKILHILKMNKGKPDSFYDKDGRLMMSFLCECGERSNIFCIDSVIDDLLTNQPQNEPTN